MSELQEQIKQVQAQKQALKEIQESDFIQEQIDKAFKEIFGEENVRQSISL